MGFNRSLVNWCCGDHQDDNRILKATESKISRGFSSFTDTKVHSRSSNCFTDLHKHKKKPRTASFKTNIKRNEELSFFVRAPEQLKKNIEDPLEQDKQKAQSQCNSAANSTAPSRQSYSNNGDRSLFNFRHFADPEEVLTEYINVYVYNRTRLERVDKKRVSAAVIALHNIQKAASVETHDPEGEKLLNANSFSENFLRTTKSNSSFLKLEKRLPSIKFIAERTMATNNFIFEFGALDATSLQNSKTHCVPSIQGRRELNTASNISPVLSNTDNRLRKYKLTDGKKVHWHKSPKSVTLLPKLSYTELGTDNVDCSPVRNLHDSMAVLPNIPRKKNSSSKKIQLQKNAINSSKELPTANVNGEVANVKSNWQLLKQTRNWNHPKDSKNDQHTKKLYQTLEKMSNERNKAAGYLPHKASNSVLNPSKKTMKDQKMLKPTFFERKNNSLIQNASLKCMRSINTENDILKICHANFERTYYPGTGNENKNKGKKMMTNSKKDGTTAIKSEAEKYLDKYGSISDKDRSDNNQKTVSCPTSEAVADMLEKLNIYDTGFDIDKERYEKFIHVRTNPENCENSRQLLIAETLNSFPNGRKTVKMKEELPEEIMPAKCNENMNNAQCNSYEVANNTEMPIRKSEMISKDRKQLPTVEQSSNTNKIAVKYNNPFIEIGLNALERQIPKYSCYQIRKSNFLNKELSLNPTQWYQGSVNFSNPLNSGKKFIFGVENNSDKWLMQKIQRTVANTVRNCSTKDKEKPLKDMDKLKFYNSCDKLHVIIDKKLAENRKDKKKLVNIKKQSFVQKFLAVQNEILINPRLQAILPSLVNGLPNLSNGRAR